MATSKRWVNGLLVLLLVLLFYALNPTSEDFQAWRSGQARELATRGDSSGIAGVLKKGAGAVAGAAAGLAASGYERTNYYVCSAYALGSERYLGLLSFFVRLK
jgi:hypothetical protein